MRSVRRVLHLIGVGRVSFFGWPTYCQAPCITVVPILRSIPRLGSCDYFIQQCLLARAASLPPWTSVAPMPQVPPAKHCLPPTPPGAACPTRPGAACPTSLGAARPTSTGAACPAPPDAACPNAARCCQPYTARCRLLQHRQVLPVLYRQVPPVLYRQVPPAQHRQVPPA